MDGLKFLSDKVKEAIAELTFKVFLKYFEYVAFFGSAVLGSYLTPTLLAARFAYLAEYKWHMALFLLLSFAGLLIFLYFRFNRFTPRFPKLDYQYVIVSKEITHRYITKDRLESIRKIKIKALKNGVDSYKGSFSWSGDKFSVRSNKKGQDVVSLPQKTSSYPFQVTFEQNLRKEETIDTEVVWELEDNDNTAVPYYSIRITKPCEFLKINIEIPPELGVKTIHCEVSYGDNFDYPLLHFNKELDHRGRGTWEIHNPKLLHLYQINWYF